MLKNGKGRHAPPAQDLERARVLRREARLEPAEERREVCATSAPAVSSPCSSQPARRPGTTPRWAGRSRTPRQPSASCGGRGLRGVRPARTDDDRRHRGDRGQLPSKGSGECGAWFRDSEGNMLGIGQPIGRRRRGRMTSSSRRVWLGVRLSRWTAQAGCSHTNSPVARAIAKRPQRGICSDPDGGDNAAVVRGLALGTSRALTSSQAGRAGRGQRRCPPAAHGAFAASRLIHELRLARPPPEDHRVRIIVVGGGSPG